jgi:16S rRNA (cytidine1402-2'-O)-methyltransferase
LTEGAPREGVLYVVGTPIGNLEDVTLRALRVLGEVDRVLAEDTRRTRVLLRHHGLDQPLSAFHAHTADAAVTAWVRALSEGQRLALVSDAGTPLVSDPGRRLVAAAAEAGIRVEPIPGPSAVMAALSGAGLRSGTFRFLGFLPRSGGRRSQALRSLAEDPATSVLFEAPRRLPATLRDLRDAAGADRSAAVCRELTKVHEEIVRGSLGELAERFADPPKGEITLLVEGATESLVAVVDVDVALATLLEEAGPEAPTKAVAKALADATGLSRKEAYARVLAARAG